MKKIISISFVLVLILQFNFADIYATFGGIKGDITMSKGVYYYQEVSFVSGKPVVLKGTVTVPKIPDKDKYKLKISYQMSNDAEAISIDRKVSYNVEKSFDKASGQTIINSTIPIGGIDETITVGKDVYKLTSFKQNDSKIKDQHPAIAFISGNTLYKKVFYKNGDEKTAEAKLEISGESRTSLAYESLWSKLDTEVIDVEYSYQPLAKAEKKDKQKDNQQSEQSKTEPTDRAWDGNITLKFSTDTSSSFSYVRNDVQNISFRGGLLKTDNTRVMLEYDYKILNSDKVASGQADIYDSGKGNLNTYSFETATRLNIPKYKDIAGHWAEEAVFRLGSLNAFYSQDFFFPDDYMTREQFCRALINSISQLEEETLQGRRSAAIKAKRPNAKALVFTDVKRDSPYYIFIERAEELGLMYGSEGYYDNQWGYQFLPTRPLTREEAITVIVRSLGIEDIAPAKPYKSGFADDKDISNWAKDSIYMAKAVGIVKGYPDNTARPLQLMTRAEAATMLSQLIDHLREDITIDYRDKLLSAY